MEAIEQIPMLANFIRSETLYRDQEVMSTRRQKQSVKAQVNCTFVSQQHAFHFEFESRRVQVNEGDSKYVGSGDKSFSFVMNGID